jgi:hypothetical protein
MSDAPNTKPEQQNFADLPNPPSGSGVVTERAAFMEAALDGPTADASIEADVGDESAAYADTLTPTEDGPGDAEAEAQPS